MAPHDLERYGLRRHAQQACLEAAGLDEGGLDDTGFDETGADDELEDVASPICNGRGSYAEPEDFDGAPGGPEITIVRNSQCTVVCSPRCAFTSVCYAANPNGRACGHACSPPGFTEEECVAFVAECIGEDVSVCDEPSS